MKKKVVIIGSGFAGLSAAAFMAKGGWDVTVVEKHAIPGGRARQMKAAGFTFDMGPSWYWMPDVFERFFAQFGSSVSKYYQLERLDPSYRIYYKEGSMDLPAGTDAVKEIFEKLEPGAGKKLDLFLQEAAYKYEIGINKLVHKPGRSIREFADAALLKNLFRLDVFKSMRSHVSKFFKHPRLVQIMEFPVLFLGARPQNIPALYSLMNFADMEGGTWYPKGGMFEIVKAMHEVAVDLGVVFEFGKEVRELVIENKNVTKVIARSETGDELFAYSADAVIGGADYHHIETCLLPLQYRSYTEAYWEKRTMAPGCLLYYVGLNKKLRNIQHHSLFFDTPFDKHGEEIYTTKAWPADPLFYVCTPSVTDHTVAPEGCENLFLLVPVAAGLTGDTEELRDRYFGMIIKRMEERLGEDIMSAVVYKRSFAHNDFVSQYHSYKGNAYGLANTLMQTAILKPSCKSRKLNNLFFTGQLTVPGPGVPPSLISGEVVAREVLKALDL